MTERGAKTSLNAMTNPGAIKEIKLNYKKSKIIIVSYVRLSADMTINFSFYCDIKKGLSKCIAKKI